jgi:hypothetical protein
LAHPALAFFSRLPTLFIEVIKAGRFDIIAEFNPYYLTQETRADH